MKLRTLALISIAACAAGANAQNIAYNNFGPGDSYDQSDYHPVGSQFNYSWAMEFTSATSGELASMAFAMDEFGAYNIALCDDTGGNGPGTQLQTWVSSGNNNGLTYVYGNGSTSLTAGQNYWVTVEPFTGDEFPAGEWFYSNNTYDPVDYSYTYLPPLSWTPRPGARSSAYRVETVPEPVPLATYALLAGALLLRTCRRA